MSGTPFHCAPVRPGHRAPRRSTSFGLVLLRTRFARIVLARRSPVAFQLLWMLALSAGALALGRVPLYGAFVAGISVAIADDSIAASAPGDDPLFFLGFLAFACLAIVSLVMLAGAWT